MTLQRILVVDDESLAREYLCEAVANLGYQAIPAVGAEAALHAIEQEQPDVVMTDMRMPGMDGVELTRLIHERYPDMPVLLCTAHATIESAVTAMKHGARDVLMKPISMDAIEFSLKRIEREARLVAENLYLRDEARGANPDTIVAESLQMSELLKASSRVARTKGTILITGASGTGKERVAHFIHAASERADKPFIRVNCAALSEQLLESELFGHERGAFTGADRQRLGRFELADGGTLLLDEVGEISPAMQAKLLRVLQEDEFERVGGQKTLKVNVRVIASTNRDLAREVAAGNFREDLYYRLHVLPLHIAALKDRIADIMPLARRFASHYSRQNGLATPTITEDAIVRLETWAWPGNVRELENVIQRAVILGSEENGLRRIEAKDLVFGPEAMADGAAGEKITTSDLDLEHPAFKEAIANETMSDVERVAILSTLERTGGNKTEAARRLGLTARTLSNKMKIWRHAGLVS
ncbi:Transcriptional regulatory protein ZraR [Planctomycetes bacterium Poly30]|uniref:Transcriptional regulatory protein ZraR n=1 Tax=Saltatorellus ferox TaxID=2528018 RepID=A0A518ELN4_9BACT|nr:Transcriptional regulatory protein ZraR [Planctomycetes bacterium Poly30]